MQNPLILTQIPTAEFQSLIRETLEDLLSQYNIQPKTDSDKIGGIELAVEITGLAKPTIYNMTANSEIPHFKKNKKLYFSRNDLLRWIRNGKRKTAAEIEGEAEDYN